MELAERVGDVINRGPGLEYAELTLDSVAEFKIACNFVFS